jgi:hypothetical protein
MSARPTPAKQNKVACKLWGEVIDGRLVPIFRITGDISNQVVHLENPPKEIVEKVTVRNFEELEKQLRQSDRQRDAEFQRQADELFRQISTSRGGAVAKEIFKRAEGQRVRGSEYCENLNKALGVHALRYGITNTARRAIKLGLEFPQEEENLLKRIRYLLKRRLLKTEN